MVQAEQNFKPLILDQQSARPVAFKIEVLAIVGSQIMGAGVGFFLQQQFQRTATTQVVTRDELPELMAQEPYGYDMVVLELDAAWPQAPLKACLQHLREIPVVLMTSPSGPSIQSLGLSDADCFQVPLSAPHTEYAKVFSRALGMSRVEVAMPSGAAQAGAQDATQGQLSVRLTSRQRDVLELLLQGHGNKEIARRLSLSLGTVKIHVSALLRAFDMTTRSQIQAVAALSTSSAAQAETPVGSLP